MIAFWIYLGGMAAMVSAMLFEIVWYGKTSWSWMAAFAWPIFAPATVYAWLYEKRRLRRRAKRRAAREARRSADAGAAGAKETPC